MHEPRPGQERFVAPLEDSPLREVDALDITAPPEGQWKQAWHQLRTNPLFWASTVIVSVLAVAIVVPSLFTSADPRFAELSDSLAPSRDGHPFGFNRQGYDVWARTVYGARASVLVGLLATLIVAVIGIVTGAIAGFFGGWIDTIVSRLSDIFFSIPLLLAVISVMSAVNNIWPERGFWASIFVVVLALGAFAWPQITRQMRGAVLEVKTLEFVDAASAIGASRFENLRRHIVPNALAPVIVTATISLGVFIVAEASLSFLGLGLPSNVVSWGNDIATAQNLIRSGKNLDVLFVPATALAVTSLAFILLGEAVREAMDPKARKS